MRWANSGSWSGLPLRTMLVGVIETSRFWLWSRFSVLASVFGSIWGDAGLRLHRGADEEEDDQDEGDVRAGAGRRIDEHLSALEFHEVRLVEGHAEGDDLDQFGGGGFHLEDEVVDDAGEVVEGHVGGDADDRGRSRW